LHRKSGLILVNLLLALVLICAVLALTVDYGFLLMTRTELQRTTDAAALAGAYDLIDESRLRTTGDLLPPPGAKIREFARSIAQSNSVAKDTIDLADNPENLAGGEVIIGEFTNHWDHSEPLRLDRPSRYNTVYLQKNTDLALFFANVLGSGSTGIEAVSAASVLSGVSGFRWPDGDTGNIPVLPITVEEDYWNQVRFYGAGGDQYVWTAATGSVTLGADGIRELLLYPNDTTSGNLGTVDFGLTNNSTNDLIRQIRYGLSPADLAPYGGELRLGSDGTLAVQGDTGLSAAIGGAILRIIGQTRALPIYRAVQGTGNTTYYTVVGFAGVRIMGVKLKGAKKAVVVQLANVMSKYATVDPNLTLPNNLVYTVPILTR
jgi:hypothetical protein